MTDGTDGTDGQPDDGGPAGRPVSGGGKAAAALVGTRRPRTLARAGHLEYDRILFFSDAVFAIAITLLIVDLPVQIERVSSSSARSINSATELRNAVPGIIGFGISFAVIGLFWVGHHALFRYIKAFDRPLMLLNLLFLGTIAFLPYPTELLSSVSSNQPTAVIFYAVCAGTAGLVETVLWLYATHARTGLVKDMSPEAKRLELFQVARGPVVFALSIGVALVSPRAATYSWGAIFLASIAINRFYGQHEPAEPEDQAEQAEG
jgi:uncharacterized membrane protein